MAKLENICFASKICVREAKCFWPDSKTFSCVREARFAPATMFPKWLTGFVHFFRPKIQGLFKDFQGPNFELSRTSFLFTSKNLRMEIVWQYNSCSFSVTKMRLYSSSRLYDMTWVADYFYWSYAGQKKFKDFQGPGIKSREFQGLSRPWKCTLKIQGFSRRVRTLGQTGKRLPPRQCFRDNVS